MGEQYRKARLSNAGDDLTKEWVVVYYAWSMRQQRLVRKRVVVKGETLEARRSDATGLIRKINKMLKAGFVVDVPPATPTPVTTKAEGVTTVKQAITHFLKLKKTTLKPNSYKTYKSSIAIFQAYAVLHRLDQARLVDFTVTHAYGYMDYILLVRMLSNKSYNKHLGTVETLFNLYKERKLIAENPFVTVKPLPERAGKHTPFSPSQIGRIRELCRLSENEQLWLFLNFIYFTFARPGSELRLLRVGDIGPATIRINPDDAKNNRVGYVTIPPPLERLIEQHRLRSYPAEYYVFTGAGVPGEKPVYEKYFYNQHRQLLTVLNLTDKPYDLYGWKHTGVIALYQATKDVKLIQRQCRHQSLDQTDKYLRELGLFLQHDQFEGLAGLETVGQKGVLTNAPHQPADRMPKPPENGGQKIGSESS